MGRQLPKVLRKTIIATIFALPIVFNPNFSMAQGPPIFTDNAITLGLEGKAVRAFGRFESTPSGERWSFPVMVPFEPFTYTQIGFHVPYVVASTGSRWGDVGIFVKNIPWIVDEPARTRRAGWTLHAEAGSTTATLLYSYLTVRTGWYGELGWRAADEVLRLNVAYGYRLLPEVYKIYPEQNLNVYLEGSIDIPRAGGYQILLSPGIQWIVSAEALLEAGIQVPVITERGPTFNWAGLAGIRWLL